MCDSSFTDYDSSSDEFYSPAPVRLRTTLPKCQGVNLIRPSLYSEDSCKGSCSTVNSTEEKSVDPFEEKDEVVYENLVKPPLLDTSVLYGQLLRSSINQISDKKRQEKLLGDVLALFGERPPWAPKNVSSDVSFVESQLRKMSERRPTEYKRTAEALCNLLNKVKQERPSRFATIRRSFRRIVGKK